MSDVTNSTESVEAPVTPEVVVENAPEVTPEVTPTEPQVEPTPEISSLDDLSEEELMAAIEAAIAASEKPTEPVSFPKVQPKEEVSAELNSEIKELLQLKESELAEAKRTLQENQSTTEQIESAWWMLNEALPDLPDMTTKLIAWDADAIPVFYRKDFQERLQSDPILWPLIEAHGRWEKPDYPGFVRSLAASRVKAMPKTSEADKEPTIPEADQVLTAGQMLSRGKKTISLFKN